MTKRDAERKLLDAWAVLSWLDGSPGAAGKVQRILDAAEAGRISLSMSMVNVGEVFYIVARRVGTREAESFLRDLRVLPISILAVPKRLVLEAARLKARFPISYADAFAAATAIRTGAVLVTGDPEFRALADSGDLALDWIG